ncbi:heavy metal-binding domain-containing protein [Levilactobacillus tujiorum]|uniref:YbjQ family protein n=1 Tax=Levilactobacillus tujiorum TaxID=2912243 RepID=A0ABX1L3R5_9LACO|nr:heavy metal-binding domain-containing protein [Levilactobacillus tujiorum]MCH5463956.1 YbjQ family protein [Levilactobacillus tujiorum]NLR11538.1 YbjQ family protein [Lactobacillus sp. HBUAS51387]NLR28944.1 YbjQ family protein [Levilactobacillus tujiorum]NLR32809.1 YbjQ family protein [Levilactobacillus tujiorum]
MFMTTGGLNRSHTIQGILTATTHTMLRSEKPDQFELFDGLFDEAKQQLMKQAQEAGADGLIEVRFNTEVVQMNVAPKFLVVHGYGTAVKFPK